MIDSVEAVERIVLVDLRRFPVLKLYPIDSKYILRLIRNGGLTASGLSPKRFERWLSEEFDITVKEIEIPIPAPATV